MPHSRFRRARQTYRATLLAFEKMPSIPGRFVDVMIKKNQSERAFHDRTFHELLDPSQYLSVQNRLDRLTMPVLGLWCHDDKIIDISGLDSLRNGLSHASAISSSVLSGCNHMPVLEKPEETARILGAFTLQHMSLGG